MSGSHGGVSCSHERQQAECSHEGGVSRQPLASNDACEHSGLSGKINVSRFRPVSVILITRPARWYSPNLEHSTYSNISLSFHTLNHISLAQLVTLPLRSSSIKLFYKFTHVFITVHNYLYSFIQTRKGPYAISHNWYKMRCIWIVRAMVWMSQDWETAGAWEQRDAIRGSESWAPNCSRWSHWHWYWYWSYYDTMSTMS